MAVGRLCSNPPGITSRQCKVYLSLILPHILLVHADEHILGLDVGVDDLALGVEVVEALEDLLHHDLHIGQIDSLVVASYYELEQVVAQHLIKKSYSLYISIKLV